MTCNWVAASRLELQSVLSLSFPQLVTYSVRQFPSWSVAKVRNQFLVGAFG